MFLLIAHKKCLEACGNKEILLFQTQFFSSIVIVARIEHVYDHLGKILLLYRMTVISTVECIQMEISNRFRIPDSQCIDNMVSISDDRHIVRHRTHRTVILLNKINALCHRIILDPDVTTEADLFCVFIPANLKRIAVLQPVVWHLYLIAVLNFLLEHSVTVADAASICRISQCSK